VKTSINTDLTIKGESVHVQTEDWGIEHKKLVARVYQQGRMVKSFEVPYAKLTSPLTDQTRKGYAQQLHQKVIDWVHEGGL
jgi:hypothetical protein